MYEQLIELDDQARPLATFELLVAKPRSLGHVHVGIDRCELDGEEAGGDVPELEVEAWTHPQKGLEQEARAFAAGLEQPVPPEVFDQLVDHLAQRENAAEGLVWERIEEARVDPTE